MPWSLQMLRPSQGQVTGNYTTGSVVHYRSCIGRAPHPVEPPLPLTRTQPPKEPPSVHIGTRMTLLYVQPQLPMQLACTVTGTNRAY